MGRPPHSFEGDFNKLLEHKLFARKEKCSFGLQEIHYLGHVISNKRVSMDKEKLLAVINWPIPKSVRSIQKFLGLARYYRKFMRNFATILSKNGDTTFWGAPLL